MDKFRRLEGITASFPKPNIDTDAIISVAWQRSLKTNPGDGLFAGWRYDLDGNEEPDFILNQEPFRSTEIILGGTNFGCGSSREFAVWALKRFGIKVIIAPSFGDIFYENSFKNGLLLIVMAEAQIEYLRQHLGRSNDPKLIVDLERSVIETLGGSELPFEIPAARRTALLEGLDEIDQTLLKVATIDLFQIKQRAEEPWLYARPNTMSGASSQDSKQESDQ